MSPTKSKESKNHQWEWNSGIPGAWQGKEAYNQDSKDNLCHRVVAGQSMIDLYPSVMVK